MENKCDFCRTEFNKEHEHKCPFCGEEIHCKGEVPEDMSYEYFKNGRTILIEGLK